MNYQPTAVPVTTVEEVADAIAHGAQLEYTCFAGDSYNAPRTAPNNEGWVALPPILPVVVNLMDGSGKVRAFYPIQNHEAYMAAARTLRDEE